MLVTGATGFIGRHLVHRLRENGAIIYASSWQSPGDRLTYLEEGQRGDVLTFDIRDATAVQTAVCRAAPRIVFHLAAVGTTDPCVQPAVALMVNAGGTVNLLDALCDSNVERIVLAGTSYVYGSSGDRKKLDPFNPYSASKVAAWAFGRTYWRVHDMPVVTVRPFQVYGPGQPSETLILSAVSAALADDDFAMTSGEQLRDFIFVEDVTEAMMVVAETTAAEGTSLDLGTGTGTSVGDIVRRIWTLIDTRGSIRPGALPYRSGTAMHLVADADRTAQLTGWRATTSLEEGLQRTINHVKDARRQVE